MMTKIPLQDMVRVKNPIKINRIERYSEPEEISNKIKIRNKKPKKYGMYFVAFVAVLFLLFALSFLFSETKVTLTPKIKEIPMNNNLTATKDLNAKDLSFDLVVLSGEESKTIQGGETKDVSTLAHGTVILYNAFSTLPQTFKMNAELLGSNNKIYKTVKKITVPGMKNGKIGSIEVDVVAAKAGAEYNSSPIDFKFVNYKGTDKETKFYGRSKGDIRDGFKGKATVLSALDKTSVVSELKDTLKNKLLKKVTEQIPSGFILFKDAIFLNIDDNDISFMPSKDDASLVSANIKGSLYGFLFDEKKLTKKIAQDIIEKYDDSEVYISNIRNLTFTLADKENISFADVKDISFNLTGTPKIIYRIDTAKFISSMLNKKKNEFNKILSQFPSIDTAQLVLRPFWKVSFPDQTSNIEVIVNYPQ